MIGRVLELNQTDAAMKDRNAYRLRIQVGLVITLLATIGLVNAPIEAGETEAKWTPVVHRSPDALPPPATIHKRTVPPPPRPDIPVVDVETTLIEDGPFDVDDYLPLEIGPPPTVDDNEDLVEPDTFLTVEEMPELRGGIADLNRRIKYPEMAKRVGIEGRVTIEFIVDENGDVAWAQVLKGIGGGCDEEALRAVRESKFSPGRQRGRAVKVRMSLPVVFRLR